MEDRGGQAEAAILYPLSSIFHPRCDSRFPPDVKPDNRRADMKKIAFLFLTCAFLFSGCGMFKSKKDKKPDVSKRAKAELRDENPDVEFQAFLGRLKQAIAAHDVTTIAGMMTEDFGYSLNPERSGDGVFKYWDENGLWPELEGIMTEKFVKKGEFWVAPPQFADESLNYDGYRAGIRRVRGSWKFVYFVNG